MSDVAALAGVSHQTVSRVINGHAHVAPETRLRVERAIAELAYRPNSAARALVTGSTRTVGLIASNISQYGPAQTIVGLERAARAAGYHVSIVVLDEATGQRCRRRSSGSPPSPWTPSSRWPRMPTPYAAVQQVRTSVPVVTVQAQGAPGLAVWVDQEAGARLATRHLLALGHRTVHHVAGPPESLDAQRRVEGWQGELRDARPHPARALARRLDPGLGLPGGRGTGQGDPARGRRPDARSSSANDQMALGLLKALHEAGRPVPAT